MEVSLLLSAIVILAIGCDGIVGAERRYDQCGICDGDSSTCQRIKIEFDERNLPAGYNKVGTIPVGACNITLTERKPTGNVFALRTPRQFFLNGQWTASPTGDYPAAGTVFRYQHIINGNSLRPHGERITARGPLTEDIEIILITKVPNEGIILEYTISTQRNHRHSDAGSPSRRHRADNYYPDYASNQVHRGDIPSIAEDFVDQPIQVEADHTSVPEISNEIPVTPEPRQPERYRWTVAGYTACSRTCGRGVKHSRLVCMMESSRQIVDDIYCASVVKPAVFQEACNERPCRAEWQYGDWSACSVTCGTGTQTREARCREQQSDGTFADVGDETCGTQPTHSMQRSCQMAPCQPRASYYWRSGEWSTCDATCGRGTQRRQVKCFDQVYGSEVGDQKCREPKPAETQACDGGVCAGTWLVSEWNHCSNGCGNGQTNRHLVCFKDNRPQDAHMCDATQRPETHQTCTSQKECGGRWFEGPWSDCSAPCGVGSQTRPVICLSQTSYDRRGQCEVLPESECKYHPKPETQRQCQSSPCREGTWYTSPWNPCSHSCGVGVRSRQVVCLNQHKELSNDCLEDVKPSTLESCGTDVCPSYDDRNLGAQGSVNPSWVAYPSVDLNNKAGTGYEPPQYDPYRRPVDLNNKAGTLNDRQDDARRRPVDLNNKAGTQYDAQPQQDYRPPVDLNNKAGTLYDAQPQQDYRPPIDLNNKAGTLYDAQPQQDYRPPIDLNNKAGTLYDAQPQQDYRPPIDLNNKAGTLYDAQPQQDYRRPVDLNNKAGTLYDAQPQQDYRPPVDLNNKAGTLYDAQPQQDYRPPVDLNNKAGTLYDAQPQQDYRPPVDLNNKAGTLYDAQPQQDYRPPVDLNNKAGTLYDAQPQQDYRRPVDLNNKAGTLYDAQPQQDYRPPVDLNNKAGTLYDAQPQQDYRPPVDLNNKAGTLYDGQPQQDYRPPVDLNNKAGTLYDAQPQQDYRPPVDLNNKAGTLYDAQPQQDYRPPIDLNNKAGVLNDPPVDLSNKGPRYADPAPRRPPPAIHSRKGDSGVRRTPPPPPPPPPTTPRPVEAGPQPGRGDTPYYPASAARSSQARRAANGVRNRTASSSRRVDIDVGQSGRTRTNRNGGRARQTTPSRDCVDSIDRCRTVVEMAFCRYDYYKKMCCKSCAGQQG
ncbi:uncharacterized protein LOC129601811 [Paramacrobiotus metropolitanus]|uniref:uncharacterized protein LOC129601811 n=1 Tax=Paramacrobiotus metropolitanus TaxID=2943436 RepID=UPI0024460D52|nr:uncharacterized protein LOC129601811 [Paramacrobiotus metropolitanus]XP_055356688.1 uncharacterized protein LOC129601811 [Paramacrobiotus metropolitanus]XP_055356689.1 uncharacterized protein LOC129601811 [Paramacrobiotus metropolitanus]